MRHTPTREQCQALLAKHGVVIHAMTPKDALVRVIKEAYRAGADSDLMKIKHKETT